MSGNEEIAPCSTNNRNISSQSSDISLQFHFIKSEDFRRGKAFNQNQYVGYQIYPNPTKFKHYQVGNSGGPSLVYETVPNESLPSNLGLLKWKYKCPTCHGNASVYYCAECIKKGNFYHSSVKYPERYADKRLRECQLRQKVVELGKKAESEVPQRLKAQILKRKIENLRERNNLIKKVIEKERSKVLEVQKNRSDQKRQVLDIKKLLPKFRTKISNIRENISLYSDNIPKKEESICRLENTYKEAAEQHIREISSVIFPITIIKNRVEEYENPMLAQMVKGIAEATQTHYVRGKWITVTQVNQKRNFSIVSSVLPESGEYSSYTQPNPGFELSAKQESENICAGLSFLCQLINVIASYLHVHLPKSLSFREFSSFSRQEMHERKFQRLVSRLNANVFYLCLTQNVPVNALHPYRALPNLLALMAKKQFNLGTTITSFDSLNSGQDEFKLNDFDDFQDSDSESEWETVNAETLPEYPMPPPSAYRKKSLDETASGLVTSAAASVLSMFGIGNR